jgi:hypothetical protein
VVGAGEQARGWVGRVIERVSGWGERASVRLVRLSKRAGGGVGRVDKAGEGW